MKKNTSGAETMVPLIDMSIPAAAAASQRPPLKAKSALSLSQTLIQQEVKNGVRLSNDTYKLSAIDASTTTIQYLRYPPPVEIGGQMIELLRSTDNPWSYTSTIVSVSTTSGIPVYDIFVLDAQNATSLGAVWETTGALTVGAQPNPHIVLAPMFFDPAGNRWRFFDRLSLLPSINPTTTTILAEVADGRSITIMLQGM